MKNMRLQSGSALLLVLLVLVGVSGVSIVASRALLSAQRENTSNQFEKGAETAARAGLEEAMLRFNKGGTNTDGEYGDGVGAAYLPINQYQIGLRRRGYQSGTTPPCTQLLPDTSVAASQIDLNCPYYDLAIHTIVAGTKGGDSLLGSADLPLNSAKTFSILKNPGSVVLHPNFSSSVPNAYICTAGCTPAQLNQQLSSDTNLVLDGSNSLKLTVLASGLTDAGFTLLNDTSEIVIKKNITRAQVIGYEGGIQKKYLATFAADGPHVIDFAQSFSNKGVVTSN